MENLNRLLDKLEQLSDGELRLTNQSGQWRFYVLDGQLLYAADQTLGVRRFRRAARYYRENWKWAVEPEWNTGEEEDATCWEILLLERAIAHRQLSPIQVKLILRMVVGECFFEVLHDANATSEWVPSHLESSSAYRSSALSLSEVKRILGKSERLVKTWKQGPLAQYRLSASPMLLPGVETDSLPIASRYLEGNTDAWDILFSQVLSIEKLIALFLSMVETGALQFKEISDLPLPIASEPANAGAKNIEFAAPEFNAPSVDSTAAASGSNTAQTVTSSAALPAAAPSQPALIACIDDSPVLTLALKKILTSAGYRTLSIPEPMQGFSKLIEHRPNLILLDLMLPNADGYSICKFLRETPAFGNTPIIILTGQDTNLDRMRARLAGATAFLTKPPKPAELITTISHHLQQSVQL